MSHWAEKKHHFFLGFFFDLKFLTEALKSLKVLTRPFLKINRVVNFSWDLKDV